MELDVILSRNFTSISPEYKAFAKEKSECRGCSLFDCYKQVGQSEGNAINPNFMFVGEALGKDEVEQVRPFIGRAGQRLREELRKHTAFSRNSSIISNVLSCRPPDNRFPRDSDGSFQIRTGQRAGKFVDAREVVNFCATSWLRREIEMLRPKVIITLGSIALDYVRGDRGISEHRGSWKFLPQFRAWSVATYHPSYVLRCANDPAKDFVCAQFEDDIKKVATTWETVVLNDKRMAMSDEDWRNMRAIEIAVDKKLLPASSFLIEYD